MADVTQMRTTRFVRRVLGIFTGLGFLLAVLFPLMAVGMVVSHGGRSENWGVNVDLMLQYRVDLAQLPGLDLPASGIRTPEFKGFGSMNLNTHSLTALYVWAIRTEIGILLALFTVWQLRVVFVHICDGEVFSVRNAGRLIKIGYVSIAASLITPCVAYFGSRLALKDIAFQVPGFELMPISPFIALSMGVAGLLTGLMIVVLARVMQAAARMNEDQELTV